MPVRSLQQSVWRWPNPEDVLAAVQDWIKEQQTTHPNLKRVGVYGSYGRGTASVGSDLDLLLVDTLAQGPQHQRLQQWPLERLPLSCDALILTPSELEQLLAEPGKMANALRRDLRWLS